MILRRLIAFGVFAFLLSAYPMFAQQVAPTAAPDHVHIFVPDPEATLVWYMKHFGGQRLKNTIPNGADILLYDKTLFRFNKSADAKPSDGSVIDRVGFTADDVEAKTAELVADGAKVLQKPGPVAFVQDPWGGKIEILHPEGVPPNRLYLIVIRSTDPAAVEKWAAERFGGTPDKLNGRFDGIKYGDLWVIFQKSDTDTAPSRGHAIDHIGWAVPNTNEAIASARSQGDKITVEPRTVGPLTIGFIEGPNGLAVELTQTASEAK